VDGNPSKSFSGSEYTSGVDVMIIATIGLIFILAGLVLDVLSLFLGVRRVFGNGPSGVPVIPLVLYALGVLMSPPVKGFEAWMVFGLLVLIHFLCQFLLLLLITGLAASWRRRGRNQPP
jgi:hypothetical protein